MSEVISKLHYQESEDKMIEQRVQDVEPYLDANKAKLAAQNDYRPFAGKDMKQVASIPEVIAERWTHQYGPQWMRDPALLRRLLNDPDNKFLRTCPGKL